MDYEKFLNDLDGAELKRARKRGDTYRARALCLTAKLHEIREYMRTLEAERDVLANMNSLHITTYMDV